MIRRRRIDTGHQEPSILLDPTKTGPSNGGHLKLSHGTLETGPATGPNGVHVRIAEEPIGPRIIDDGGGEKLQRHGTDIAGHVWIPDIWGQEELLKDWIDCAAFDSSLIPSGLMLAREALVEECRRANSNGLSVENPC